MSLTVLSGVLVREGNTLLSVVDLQISLIEQNSITRIVETVNLSVQKGETVGLIGPTGSGKTSTLYAALNYIKGEEKNIITLEDPIEYLLDGINQIQLNPAKNVTFASGLRSILRQDPNVILVGEIRDSETASIAFQASMTGHLVFSTLHTNDASGAIARLIDMGIEPFLISSSVRGVLAQRLVRVICPKCKGRLYGTIGYCSKCGLDKTEFKDYKNG